MSGGPLAVPTFFTGARDEVAAADVYTRTTSTPINSIQTIATQSDITSSLSGLRGGKSMSLSMPSLSSLLSVGKSLLSSKGDPLARLTQAAGPLASALRSMSPGASQGILGSITSSLGGIASMNGVKSLIPTGNITNANNIGNLINSLTTGNGGAASFSMLDKGALSGGLSGIINTASSAGLKNSFGPIMTGITDKTIINSVAGSALPSVIKGGDLGSLSSMASMCSPGALKMINPNILGDVAGNFTAPPGINYLGTMENFNNVQDTFKKIDPPWVTTTRQTGTGIDSIGNITAIQGCTPDFQNMLSTGIKSTPDASFDQQNLLLASSFPRADVISDLKKDFPLTMLSGNSSSANTTNDPRTVVVIQSRNLTPAEVEQVKAQMAALTSKNTRDLAFMDRIILDRKAALQNATASGQYSTEELKQFSKDVDAAVQERQDIVTEYNRAYQKLALSLTTIS